MKHSFNITLLLLCQTIVQAQPCSPNELSSIYYDQESSCEANFDVNTYYNFTSIYVIRNNIRTGTLQWHFRIDSNTAWQNLSMSWQGQGSESIDKPDFMTSDNGQYLCVFTDTVTGCKDSLIAALYVHPRPNFNITIESSDCSGMFLGTSLNNDPGQILTHCWEPDFGMNPPACETTASSYLFNSVGCMAVASSVSVIATNQYGCENLTYINGLCNLEYLDTYASLNTSDTIFCAKTGILEVKRASGIAIQAGWTFQWLKNNTSLSWATNQIIKPTASGKYKCIVTNSDGCTATTNEISVIVNKLPTLNIQPSGITEICNKDTIILTSGSASSNTYNWYRNGIPMPQTTTSIGVFSNGNYKVVATSPQGCSATSAASKINIYRSKIEATGPVVICAGDSTMLQNLTPNTVTRQWQFNNVSIPSATSSQFAAKQSGLYRVKSTSAGGCVSYSNQIDISVNCREALQENYLLHISPVPSSHFINLGSFETSGNFRINITDMNGKIILEKNNSHLDIQQLDISGLVSGMYIIHFSDDAGIRSGKFIRD
jgi:hypothetical protein